jgi:hypothetical protein
MALDHQNLAGPAQTPAGRGPSPGRHFIPDLEQLTHACGDKLACVKPLLETALGIARGKHA